LQSLQQKLLRKEATEATVADLALATLGEGIETEQNLFCRIQGKK
jgi:hypothetical protein